MSEKDNMAMAMFFYHSGVHDGIYINSDVEKDFQYFWDEWMENYKDRKISVSRTCWDCKSYGDVNPDRCKKCRKWYIYLDDLYEPKEKEDCAEKFYNKVNFETNQNASDTEEDDES